ncbi:MAG: flagellar basal body rod protein FlgB [Gammaproteobacteria bacterium]|nr:flagellar basal body rod protein FlgB [Gammaproteobacteria bacterium]
MAISFDNFLGIHDDALTIRSKRAELLASNIANSDTPNYKAQDIDFKQALENSKLNRKAFDMNTTNQMHIEGHGFMPLDSDIKYRNISQPSVDGNTVDTHVEKAAFGKNTLEYTASLRFLNGKFTSMTKVLRAMP